MATLRFEEGTEARERPLGDGSLQALAGDLESFAQGGFRSGGVSGREAQLALQADEVGLDEVLALAGGGEAYTEATLSLAFDPGQHVALAVTYKDGAEPPVFVKVDKYSVGVVLKY